MILRLINWENELEESTNREIFGVVRLFGPRNVPVKLQLMASTPCRSNHVRAKILRRMKDISPVSIQPTNRHSITPPPNLLPFVKQFEVS